MPGSQPSRARRCLAIAASQPNSRRFATPVASNRGYPVASSPRFHAPECESGSTCEGGKEGFDIRGRMRGGHAHPKARRPFRHGRRPDRGHVEALAQQPLRQAERRPRACPWGSARSALVTGQPRIRLGASPHEALRERHRLLATPRFGLADRERLVRGGGGGRREACRVNQRPCRD